MYIKYVLGGTLQLTVIGRPTIKHHKIKNMHNHKTSVHPLTRICPGTSGASLSNPQQAIIS